MLLGDKSKAKGVFFNQSDRQRGQKLDAPKFHSKDMKWLKQEYSDCTFLNNV